ncbi:MAG: methylmalonyl-CoA mutase family protein, partial [Planctomycetota bacterium]|nr:methylmalonyl-CoA mutase family protein [Planctomycetota bacterium]
NSRDEALSLPDETSARIALRTQQIIAHETGAADVIDPLGGCPYVEELTDTLERGARALLDEIEEMGGSVAAIESGFMQREIHKSAMAWQRAVESGDEVVVGLNRFQVEEPPPSIFRPDAGARDEVLADLDRVRAERDAAKVEGALQAVRACARGTDNVMGAILAAVEAYATVGEICAALEEEFGSYRPPEVL